MVSTRPLISKFCSPCTSPLVTVPIAPITIRITVTFMVFFFGGGFSSPERPWYLSLFSLSFSFTLWSAGTIQQVLFYFLLTITRSGRLAEIRWSVRISKSRRILCVSFSKTDSGLCIYHLFMIKFKLLAQFLLHPDFSRLWANLLHPLNIGLIVSSLSPHNQHLCCCVLSSLALTKSLWRCFVLLSEEIQFLT